MDSELLVYDNTHRALLQLFLARPTVTFEESRPVIARLLTIRNDEEFLEEDVTEPLFNDYITQLNAAISRMDFEIRNAQTQVPPRHRLFALVNRTSDLVTQLSTTYNAEEIAFIQRLLHEMFEKHNSAGREVMAVSASEALRVRHRPADKGQSATKATQDTSQKTKTSQGLTGKEAERVLQRLVDEGWFERVHGYFTLSTRSLLELKDWLLETFNDSDYAQQSLTRIKLCYACRDIVTIGQRCSTRDCDVRLHEYCVEGFFRTQRNERICPKCRSQWTGRDVVGPKAA